MHDKENQHCTAVRNTENNTSTEGGGGKGGGGGVDGYMKVPRTEDDRGGVPPEALEDSSSAEKKTNSSFKDVEGGCTDTMTVPFRKGTTTTTTGESLRRSRRSWTTLERYFCVVIVVLLLTCLVLVVITFTQTLRKDETSLEICTNQHCVLTAAKILEAIDTSADPCDDFFQYACGSWNRRHIIPEDKTNYNTFEKLHDQLQVFLKGLLEEPIGDEDTTATAKSKTLYASCMNTSEIEKLGDSKLREVIRLLGGWPVISPSWENETDGWILEKVIGSLRGVYNIALLIDLWVAADDKNSSINVITLDQAGLGMPSREYYLKDSDGEHKDAYLRCMIAMAHLLGADEEYARTEMTKVLEFEEELANITIPQSEKHDTGLMYTKMTVRRLQQLTPEINWLMYFDSFLPMKINGDEEIVSLATDYLIDLSKLVHRQDKRLLANYLLWRLILNWAPEVMEKYQKERNEYRKILQGVAKEPVRWQKCVEFVNERMGMAVGRLFVRKNFLKESKDMALEMIQNIRSEFINILEESNWMDEETKSVAKEKANAMIERIGYPEFIINATELDKFYEELHVSRDRYFNNILKIEKHDASKNFNKLREPIHKDKWEQDPAVVNAFYNPNTNDIVFPAGILQPIFYSPHFPKSLNYGGIGVVIGHEITHGFDDKGRQYDRDGNLRQWWNNDTIKAFRERAQCMIDQYSSYILEPLGLHIDGRNTQGENIADNGGLKESFRAYQEWVKRNGQEPPLPGINLTHNQLFFLNYAQIWCGIMRDEEALHKLRTSVHSPGPIRVIGPLSNSYDFSRAYNCPVGSRMNPVKKCSVW